MLTNAAVKAAGARARAYKLADTGGLHLHIASTGRRTFRWRFRFDGREQLLTIGAFPAISLADARIQRDQAREQLRRGVNPCAPVPAELEVMTFEAAARAWYRHSLPRWSATHAADVIASLERDVFSPIGAIALGSINPPDVLKVLRLVEQRGSIETARRLRQRISAAFKFAISEGWATANPAADVGGALAAVPAIVAQPALTDLDEVRQLLDAVGALDANASAKLASRFLALTAVRFAAVRGARWNEFEDIDGDAPLWRVPAERLKLRRALKAIARNDHYVPLSPAAVDVLRAARAIAEENGHDTRSGLVFVGRSGFSPLGERAISDLYARTRFAGQHVPHGWRAAFSTILNEQYPEERAAIDLALGHAPKRDEDGKADKVEGAYNRARHLARRRRLLDRWAELLAGPARGDRDPGGGSNL